jgi:hypothetical protein
VSGVEPQTLLNDRSVNTAKQFLGILLRGEYPLPEKQLLFLGALFDVDTGLFEEYKSRIKLA